MGDTQERATPPPGWTEWLAEGLSRGLVTPDDAADMIERRGYDVEVCKDCDRVVVR